MKQEIKKKEIKEICPQEIIQRDNKIFIIEKSNDESREVYLARVNYIINKYNSTDNNKKINNDDFMNIIKLSYIWRNIKFKKMVYPSSLTKLL